MADEEDAPPLEHEHLRGMVALTGMRGSGKSRALQHLVERVGTDVTERVPRAFRKQRIKSAGQLERGREDVTGLGAPGDAPSAGE